MYDLYILRWMMYTYTYSQVLCLCVYICHMFSEKIYTLARFSALVIGEKLELERSTGRTEL